MLLFLALLLNATYVQYVRADALNDRNGNRRVIDAEFSREAGADPRRRATRSRPAARSTTAIEFQRRYPQPFRYAHLTGYFSYLYGASGRRGEPERDPLRERLPALRRPGRRPGEQHPAAGRLGQPHRRRSGPDRGVRRDPRARHRTTEAAVVAIEPSTGRLLAMVVEPDLRPQPARLARPRRACRSSYERLIAAPGQPAVQPGDPGDLSAGLDLQARHRAPRPWRAAATTPDTSVRGGTSTRLPGDRARDLPNSGGSDCGGERITLTQALMVSCNVVVRVRWGWTSARDALGGAGARRSASASEYLEGLGGQAIERLPRRPRRAADGALGDRAVRGPRDAAADGAGRRHDRQQRAGDAALPRRRGARARPERPGEDAARRRCPSARCRRSRRRQLTQMMVEVVDRGHRRDRPDPRDQGRRQDRHRAERRRTGRRTPGSCQLRARRRPAGGGRGAGGGRRRRARRDLRQRAGGADREAGHGGGAAVSDRRQPDRAPDRRSASAGRYELGELLGRGGMAEVRRGTDLRLGRTVAVKRLRTDLADRPDVPGALPARGAVGRRAQPPQHRLGLRHRRGDGARRHARAALHRHGVRRGAHAARGARRRDASSSPSGPWRSPRASSPRSTTATAPASSTATSSRPT